MKIQAIDIEKFRKHVYKVGKDWGIKSMHGEWTDGETLELFAKEIIEGIYL